MIAARSIKLVSPSRDEELVRRMETTAANHPAAFCVNRVGYEAIKADLVPNVVASSPVIGRIFNVPVFLLPKQPSRVLALWDGQSLATHRKFYA